MTSSMDSGARQALAEYLGCQLGRAVALLDAHRVTVGHSRAMFRVETDAGRFMVRVEQGGVFGTSGVEEFSVMRALREVGFPVATARWHEPTGDVLGSPFFVMDLLDAVPDAQDTDERNMDDSSATSFVVTMARLHALDTSELARAFEHCPRAPDLATHDQIRRWGGVYRASVPEPIPLLEEAEAWLHRHAPSLGRLSVVHGDAGPGNVVVSGGDIVAVTDWEFAHLGDPAEDWSFCMSMRGRRTMPRERWLDLFRRHAGVQLSDAEWRYWEAFNLFKGACANTTGWALFESGSNRAPDMAIIGTHLHQSFLRRLIDITGGAP